MTTTINSKRRVKFEQNVVMKENQQGRSNAVAVIMIALGIGGPIGLQAASLAFTPGDLVLTRSVYSGVASTVTVGQPLPGGGFAVADGRYPLVFNNNTVDGSFGVTTPIYVDDLRTDGSLVGTMLVDQNQIVTSFSSKSELAINLSADGTALTFLGYVAPANALDVSNSNTANPVDPTDPVTSIHPRAVAQINYDGTLQVTPVNAYSGNNGRAVVLANGSYYLAGNAGNSGPGPTGTTLGLLSDDTGVQMIPLGANGDTTVVGAVNGTFGNGTGYQRGYSITQYGFAADKTGKDDNFRGLRLFANTLYVTKGSGGNGINTVFQVGTAGSVPSLADAGTTPITILPGFYTGLAKNAGARFPFGIWFADANTLYVADEGDGKIADAAKDLGAGLQKWIRVNGSWQLAYTLQKGLGLGVSYSVANGPNGEVYPTALNPATDGLRNIVGQVNGYGIVTIYGVTSTVSSSGDQGADPNKLVAITDTLAFTTTAQAASEQFVTMKTAGYAEVFRGVAFAPGFTFTGVASGDATSSEATLWTRVSEPQGSSVPLTLQLATDPGFASVVQTYAGNTDPGKDNVLKINATGLQPGTRYYYRFVGAAPLELPSNTGTFKTAPDENAATALRFAFSGDADGLMRPYPLAHDFNQLGLDFFVWLGDTIYETASSGSPAVALSGTIPAPTSSGASPAQLFTDYSRKFREQFLPVHPGGQNCLQTLFASQGNYTLYDNHELGNRQYINGGAAPGGPVDSVSTGAGVDARVAANDVNMTANFMNKAPGFETLQQVYLNYQPVHEHGFLNVPADPRTDGTPPLFLAQRWGRNAIFINADDRSYRDIRMKTAANADDTGARADNPNRTMLGATQLAWLKQTLLDAQKTGVPWKFVAISSPIDQLGPIGGALDSSITITSVNSDGGKSWMGGYRAERNDLLKFIADNHILNVVFLSTDDHQNRVNELLYSPTGDTANQSSYVRIPRCFTIVDGPLGATGPDTITDHSFAHLKAIADGLAGAQASAGLDPIGLDPQYPGLINVSREGDASADTQRQPIDFYSPDTFNYTILDIGADCPTLTVTTYGINSYQVNTFPEASAVGPVRPILSFQIEGDIEPPVIQSVGATPHLLWPPDHTLIPILISVAATDNYAVASAKIVSVTSNAPQNGTGDGNTSPDWVITGNLTLQLRAERAGSGNGRIYTITVEVADTCGNKTYQTSTVTVPKSNKP
jgi:phosphodiesterase/alkaline phosphatase D-like protein